MDIKNKKYLAIYGFDWEIQKFATLGFYWSVCLGQWNRSIWKKRIRQSIWKKRKYK